MKLPFVAGQLTLLRPPLPELWPFALWSEDSSIRLMSYILRGFLAAIVNGDATLGTRVLASSAFCQVYIRIRRGIYLPWTLTSRRRSSPFDHDL